jgi:hypothetical protein
LVTVGIVCEGVALGGERSEEAFHAVDFMGAISTRDTRNRILAGTSGAVATGGKGDKRRKIV